MGIGYSTLQTWKSKYQDIQDTLKKGKDVIDFQVENALLESALDGNTTAQIFWLKNRRPDKWRDKQNVELSGALEAEKSKLDDLIKQMSDDG